MVRWTETRDSYRATFMPDRGLFGLGMFVILMTIAALAIEAGAGRIRLASVFSVLMGLGAFLLCLRMALLWSRAPWIDIPLRGGPITWGRGESTQGWTSTPVSYFDVEQVMRPSACCRLVAILDDGRTRYPIVTMSAGSPTTLAPLVTQLNGHLAVESAVAVDLPDLAERHRRRRWTAAIVIVVLAFFVIGPLGCGLWLALHWRFAD